MKTQTHTRNRLVAGIALALFMAPLVLTVPGEGTAHASLFPAAQAAEQGSGKGGQQGAHGSDRGKGGQGISAIPRGGNRTIGNILAGEEEDSDRPDWAGGQKELNPHRGTGSHGSDTQKGVDYGDIWVILRDDLGNPILDDNGNVQPCLDAACTEVAQLTEDGELPPEYADSVIPVEFGRLNIARAPSKVLENALVEALSKLDGGVVGDTITLDPSGRLVIDGKAIDSPRENLALYVALLTAPAVDGVVTVSVTTQVEGGGTASYSFTLPEDVRLDLAASALAASADKTGELNVDMVVNISKFLGVADELAALVGDYTYDRDETYADTQVWILVETAPGQYTATQVDILDVVNFSEVPAIDGDDDGIDRFTQAADDALKVIGYVHDNALDQ